MRDVEKRHDHRRAKAATALGLLIYRLPSDARHGLMDHIFATVDAVLEKGNLDLHEHEQLTGRRQMAIEQLARAPIVVELTDSAEYDATVEKQRADKINRQKGAEKSRRRREHMKKFEDEYR